MFRTGSLDYIVEIFDEIFVSDYVYKVELRGYETLRNSIKKLVNKDKIKILYYKDLTFVQKKIYLEAKNILEKRTTDEYVDEGEKITACYANAHKVYYYMSDDNKAAPYIKSLTGVEVINYCDILYLSYRVNPVDISKLYKFYRKYIELFDDGQIPGKLKNNNGDRKEFSEVMGMCFDKFHSNEKLSRYLDLLVRF
ncbi:MAG: hypothetical protein ACOC1O_06200 [bacterium]